MEKEQLGKRYYKISEVAALLGIPGSTLRFWESKFTVVHPKRNAGGQRMYTPNDIEKIRMIYYLVKEKGLKLDAAQEQLRTNTSGVSRRFEAIQRLRQIRARLVSLQQALGVLR